MNANVNVLSDRVLLNNYLSGDRSAISELIERHSLRVRSYIGMMVKDDDIANDIFQERSLTRVATPTLASSCRGCCVLLTIACSTTSVVRRRVVRLMSRRRATI